MIPKNANAMQIVVNIIANITEIVAKAWQIQLLLFVTFQKFSRYFCPQLVESTDMGPTDMEGQLYLPKTKPRKGSNIYSGGQRCTPLSDDPRQKFPEVYF